MFGISSSICSVCLGCNKLEDNNFKGVRNCSGFVPGIENWHGKYIEEVKKSEGNKYNKYRR
jgi:hypothetical protein